jgi:hypothetical protein
MYRTPERSVRAGTDDSVVPHGQLNDQISGSFVEDEGSLVKAHEATPSRRLRKNDSAQPGNTSEETQFPAACKQTHKCAGSLKEEGQDQVFPAFSTSQTPEYDSDNEPQNTYPYSPLLAPGNIRLLRLMPHKDKSARIQCQLFNYPLQESSDETHLYEALSYVWGSSDELYSIAIDGYDMHVTANLHAALLRLRNRFIERIIWVDAICINQGDDIEKANQVGYMAEIYSRASRVTVWLGEAENDSDRALEEIRLAADEMSPRRLIDNPTKQAILALLQRPWFERIWVSENI